MRSLRRSAYFCSKGIRARKNYWTLSSMSIDQNKIVYRRIRLRNYRKCSEISRPCQHYWSHSQLKTLVCRTFYFDVSSVCIWAFIHKFLTLKGLACSKALSTMHELWRFFFGKAIRIKRLSQLINISLLGKILLYFWLRSNGSWFFYWTGAEWILLFDVSALFFVLWIGHWQINKI